jgi:hypothetical protein
MGLGRAALRLQPYIREVFRNGQNFRFGDELTFEMIRATMLDPGKLRGCVNSGVGMDDMSTARELHIAGKIRRELIHRYATDQMTNDGYIASNRALDEKLERLVRTKVELVTALRPTHQEDFVDASVRQFCATAKARLQACSDRCNCGLCPSTNPNRGNRAPLSD